MDAKIVWLFIFVALYWGYCIFWGVKGALSARTASDYFIAGRRISLWVFVLAATATSFSGWTFMGHPGLLYRDGFQYAYASFYAITIPFTGVIFLKRQWMLGKRFGFVTPGEMLSTYFKSDVIRLLVVLVALIFSIPYLGLQLRASGFLFNVLTDGLLGVEAGMWLLSLVVIIYVASGGLRAVAYVDTAQAILLAFGIVVIGIIAVNAVGGWDALNERIAVLAQFDTKRTPGGYSHYIAIPGVIQMVSSGPSAQGGAWTGVMVLTYMFALMGIQSAPAFSMWAFSNHNPRPFAPQQVWASSFGIGIILMVFTAMQGLGGHFLGADQAFMQAHPELVNNVMQEGLQGKDLMESAGKQGMLVPQLIRLMGDTAPWLVGLLSVCALAAMQSTGAAYMSTAGGMLTRDLLKRYIMPNASHAQQKLWGRIGVVIIVLAALMVATNATDALVLLGGLAVAYGFQMWPALIAVCWWPWLTRQGVTLGLIAGLIAVTLTEKIGMQWFGIEAWGRWPLTMHSAGWGILFNLGIAVIVSAITQSRQDLEHRMTFHSFLREHATLPAHKKGLVPVAWIIVLVWFFFGIGPGAVIGNTIFGNPNDAATWTFGMPSIWAWQLLWWALGVFMMWFLAYKMEMSTVPEREIVALHEDIGDIHLDVDKP
ncbi:MAG: sodium:solute symporter [Gammaproteobacteria bacterium]|nr:sodium:solute symporter [Gammaproteobacteria bacterium]NIR97543.1 sodium:solute symporter [Gammaproteobacteria bacterium]NIT63176.1 sodium:solute symporter [Gammaproteobacteria bacterium]NIV20126.1 sodium:solute symporter family protein [Gammaproteobacteria bacterium]NIX11426.1 sodium:solute symporter family protein [Gammaproteobacteria bacterium]